MNSDVVKQIFSILAKEFGSNIGTELFYENNYQLLVAIMLSAQTTDSTVNKVTDKLFTVLHKPKDAIEIGRNVINNYIKAVNYHNVKSRYIVDMSKRLIDCYDGKVPDNFNDLISLAGVGRKTANLMLSIAFKKSSIAVDTHVFRVSNRLGIVNAGNVLETEKQLAKFVPSSLHRQINNLLIPCGRKYCHSIRPKCDICPLRRLCNKKIKLNKD